ncbi:uncharacterized protein TNCV_1925811 [Trichonephila clavipes]|nr:uncharacterized protein TNCV_1925811 [Trichonephila clavipes]
MQTILITGVPKVLCHVPSMARVPLIHLRWDISHVNIVGNEIADALAKDGAAQPTRISAPLTYSELHSTYINNKQSTVPPAHHWYEAKLPAWLDMEMSNNNTLNLPAKLAHPVQITTPHQPCRHSSIDFYVSIPSIHGESSVATGLEPVKRLYEFVTITTGVQLPEQQF